MLPLWVFRHRVILPAILTALVVGVLLIGLTSYIPLYGQSVLGHSALAAGFALAALTLGWPLSAANAGRLYLTIGFRSTMVLGSVIGLVGSLLLLTLDGDSSLFHLAVPVLRHGSRLRLRGRALGDRGPVRGRLGVARGHDRRDDLRPDRRQRDRRRRLRRPGQRQGHRHAVGHANPDLESLSAAVLEPAIRTVFVGSAIVAVALVAREPADAADHRPEGRRKCRQRTLWSRPADGCMIGS